MVVVIVVVIIVVVMEVENLSEGDARQVVQGEAWSQGRAWREIFYSDRHQDFTINHPNSS